MKKVLLATTAIIGISMLAVTVAEAAEDPTLSFGASIRTEAWFFDQTDKLGRHRGHHFELDDASLTINGRGEADNGLTYGTRFQVDIDAAVGLDEAAMFFSGPWGRLELGSDDGPVAVMEYGAESLIVCCGFGFDGGPSSVFNFNGLATTMWAPNLVGNTGDPTRINYYTPRISGLQMGVSYVPDLGQGTGSGGATDGPAGANIEHIWQVAVNYVEKIGGIDVALSGGIVTGGTEADNIREDTFSWRAGGTLGWGAWGFGASYGDSGDSNQPLVVNANGDTNTNSDSAHWWNVGGSYTAGPYQTSLTYIRGEQAIGPGIQPSTSDFISLALVYRLAPGLRVYGEYDYININQEEAAPGAGDNSGNVFMMGTRLDF